MEELRARAARRNALLGAEGRRIHYSAVADQTSSVTTHDSGML
jgi:hypothetical protein